MLIKLKSELKLELENVAHYTKKI